MSEDRQQSHWVFSNKPAGAYKGNIWDMSTILRTNRYTIRENENNRKSVSAGDIAYMRIYSDSYIGRFTIGSEWRALPPKRQTFRSVAGQFGMRDVEIWQRPLPQNLIIRDLSNQNVRRRIIRITDDDALMIETARCVYERLGFGGADGQIVILEKGLEEAIKPNLRKLGLRLADKRVQQQFSMGPGVGRSDLICVNDDGDLIVVELKRGMASDQTIGQILRYVGWVRENIAEEGQPVHGWVVAGDYDESLRLAASAAGIKLLLVRLG